MKQRKRTDPLTPKMTAAIDLIHRCGTVKLQVRYSDDEIPGVWFVVTQFPNGVYEVDAALDPERALLRLCERITDGGTCLHCGRMTGLDPDSLETMPMNDHFCWYQYDPELQVFRRGCEGDMP